MNAPERAVQAVVTDIEGTTSSLAFVKDVLFPYAAEHLADFVRRHADDRAVAPLLDDARLVAGRPDLDVEAVIRQMQAWIAADEKVTPLKTLQGLIWGEGYRNGELKGHVYADAPRNLRAWRAQGLELFVYSSGSVWAQKLLFAHTEFGDLTPLFSGYFDTHIGHKRDADSYRRIQAEIGRAPDSLLFLSDIVEELDAAAAAGWRTCGLARDGVPLEDGRHRWVRDFDAIAGVAPG